jgi:lactoylglutathione lyase
MAVFGVIGPRSSAQGQEESMNYPERLLDHLLAIMGLQRGDRVLGCIDLRRLCRTNLPRMRMLHVGLRVSDLEHSLAFYTALGYAELGGVPETEFGSLTMLQLPDDPFVSLELVHDPERPVEDVGAVNHLVVQVDDLDATIADLAAKGVAAEPPAEPGPRIRTSWLTDPDGYRIELVQWPPGHPAGMTAADFAPSRGE